MDFQNKILEKVQEMLAWRKEDPLVELEFNKAQGRLFINSTQIVYFTPFENVGSEGKFVTASYKIIEQALQKFNRNKALIVCREIAAGMNETLNMNVNRFEIHSKPENLLIGNLNKHALVPPHQLLTPAEEKELPYQLEKLPLISVKDPIIQYNGWKQGIVRIQAIDGIHYRRIVT